MAIRHHAVTHEARPGRGSQAELIAIAALLMATVALSIDIILPAMGDIAVDFEILDSNRRQWIITTLFVGLVVGQLLFGPLSDSIGRRPAILAGVVIFVAGSLICAFSKSFEWMLIGRAVQGLGAAGPRIVTVALIRDRFEGKAMARLMSVIMGVFIMVPVLAPLAGQGLLSLMPWRGLFAVLAGICLVGGVWLLTRQPETLNVSRPLRPSLLVAAMREVATSGTAIRYTLAGGCCYGALMGYVNSSQQLFQDFFGLGDRYAVLFGASAAFISAATLVNSQLVQRYSMERICSAAVATMIGWTILFLPFFLAVGNAPTLWLWMVYNCPVLFLLGLTFGNFNAIALRSLGHIAGLASAVIASLTSALSLVIAALIGLSFDLTTGPVVYGYLSFGVLALLCMILPVRGTMSH